MGTRSMIAFNNGDEIYAIRCHWDGYLEGVGQTLFDHYTDIEKVEELIDLGDLSVLGKEIGDKHPFSYRDVQMTSERYNELYGDMCIAYGRDRGETGTDAKTFFSMQQLKNAYNATDCEYLYIFDGNGWSWIKGEA